jgi:hypothetical protein
MAVEMDLSPFPPPHVIAIQSRWDKVKIVFGCPIYVIMHVMFENYRLNQQPPDTNPEASQVNDN